MATAILVALVSAVAWLGVSIISSLARNLRIAKASGLPYVLSPIHPLQPFWMLTKGFWIKLLLYLPDELTQQWLSVSDYALAWKSSYEPFNLIGETFLLVSPYKIVLLTVDPEVHLQLLAATKRGKITKLIDLVKINALYGPNVMGTHGSRAKQLRKLMLPSLTNHANCRSQWDYTLQLTSRFVRKWALATARGGDLRNDLSEMSLAVIAYTCFGQKLDIGAKPSAGHKISFGEAMQCLIRNGTTVLMAPDLVLRASPIRHLREAAVAKYEFLEYLKEFQRDSRRVPGVKKEFNNLLETLATAGAASAQCQQDEDNQTQIRISDGDIFGNLFFITLAGHETVANLLDWTLCLLAIRKDVQAELHVELDRLMPADSSQWTFDKYYPTLMDGMLGALLYEMLRMYPASTYIFPMEPTEPIPIQMGEVRAEIPEMCYILQSTAATHRNSRFWPKPDQSWAQKQGLCEPYPYPVSSFNPWHWLDGDLQDGGKKLRRETDPGTFFPFFHGDRSCMGRQFAQTEFIAAVTRILMAYTVQLAPSEHFPDDKDNLNCALTKMSCGLVFDMTLKKGGSIPLVFRRRRDIID